MQLTVRLTLCLAFAFGTACANRAKHSVSLYEAGDYAGAARAAEDGLTLHPEDAGLWGMRVRAALALGDADGVARAYASYRGRRGGDDKELLRDLSIATLGQALASPSVKLKIIAINAVADAELQDLAERVAERMGDDDDRVAASAAIAVLRGYAQAPQVADEMLRSEDPEARRIAVDGIGRKVGSLAADDLEKAATDADPRVRRAAIRWLGQIKDKDAVELLIRRMRDRDEAVRASAASALARIGIGNLDALAKQALKDRALAVRLAGIELLVAAHRPAELSALAAADPDPMVATEAAIAANRPDLAAKAIERAAAAEGWTIRAGAANAAVRALGNARGLELARRLVADHELGVRLAAARVLAHGGELARAAIVFAAALSAPDFELGAASDLADHGDVRGIAALEAALRDPKRTGDQRAAAATAHRNARRVTPALVAALADASGVVRASAAAAIAVLTK